MNESNTLARMANFLYGDGAPASGLGLSPQEASLEVQSRYPNKKYCLVRQWMLVDLTVSDSTQWAAQNAGKSPRLLFAHEVVFDSAGRFAPGNWVRSTFQVSYAEDGFFETGNSVYVLLGNGRKKNRNVGGGVQYFLRRTHVGASLLGASLTDKPCKPGRGPLSDNASYGRGLTDLT